MSELELFYTTSHAQPKCHLPSEGFLSLPQYTGSVSPFWPHTVFYNSAFHSVVLRPATSASAGNLLEMQIPRSHPGSTESDTLGWYPTICALTSPPQDSDACFNSRNYQFSSVAQLCPTLCDPMNRSTPGLPVHHQLPEFTQTHVR